MSGSLPRPGLTPPAAEGADRADEPRPDPFRRGMDRLLSGGLLLAALAVTIQTVIHLVNSAVMESEWLNANAEAGLFAWASTAAIFSGAFVSALHAVLVPEHRRRFVAVAAILGLLSLDEMTLVHERIVNRFLDLFDLAPVWDSVLWPVLYAPLLGVLFLLLVSLARAAPAGADRCVLLGLVLLATAVVAEVVSAPISTDVNWAHTVEGGVEEGAELGGWIAIGTGSPSWP